MVSVKVFSSSSHLLTPTKSQAEAHLALRSTLSSALSHSPSDPPSFTSLSSEVVVPSLEQLERESNEADLPLRGELDVTVKIFLPSPSSSSSADPVKLVREALKELEKTALNGSVDSLVLAWKGIEYEGRELTFFSGPKEEVKEEDVDQGVVEKLVEVWTDLQTIPSLSSTLLGLTSFSQPLLTSFLSALPPNAKRPSANHVSLKDCCHIPQGYSDFARGEGVRLVSSSDPTEPISSNALSEIFAPYLSVLNLSSTSSTPPGPEVEWTVKYTVLHRARGVLVDKGYIVSTLWP